uniref:Dynein heavy chain 2, axonemal n=1 Tax=Cacopsylla melanoneura TaxID=428564 RepID=A0A8D8Y9A0_9HEMI
MVVLGAIRPASADKNYISNRFSNQFTVINMTLGTEMIQTIFSTMLQAHLTGFDEHIVASILQATNATINLYENVLANLIPNPDKMYYVFTTKDISKVFEGLLRSDPSAIPNKDTFTRLWVHECNRVFSDRIVDVNDKEWFDRTLSDTLNKYFDATADNVLKGRLPLFSDIIGEEGRYEEVIDSEQFMQFLKLKVKEYNEQDDIVPMDLVLFQGAMEHIIRIGRVISQPKGHLLLVGMGGSGRTYLTRISAFLYKQEFFSNQGCDVDELLTKWRHLYCEAGIHHQGTCFLFKYTTPEHEAFFGFLSAILRSGDVPGLITQKQKEQISEDLRRLLIGMKLYIPDMDVFEYFLDKVRLHFHLVFCISSTGPLFKYILKKYPYFLDFVTIDWIDNWPKESLQEVAERILEDVDMLNPEPNHSQCVAADISVSLDFSLADFLSTPSTLKEWTCYGLPQQECAVQNAVIITQSHLCPLVIDPRGQALKWMRNMREVIPLTHKKEVKPPLENLQETHIGSDNWGDVLTTALKEGHPVLLKNVTIEDIQGRLSPYITHRFVEVDSEIHLHLGDKTVPYNDKFRLFMMTKIEEHFPPEIFTNINIVNFTNDEKKGLENEFLDILMKKERPEETQILSTLRNSVFLNKKNLHQTDKDIISLLNQDLSSESTVLDNKELFSALEASEEYQEGIADDMEKMDLILKEYDRIKQVYHSVALRVVLLYFILIDLRRIDLAYVYSLGAYIKLFECSVDNSEQSDVLRTRVDHIIDHFTYAVYKSTCPGLYEHHKLLFSFLMCVRILSENKDQKDLVFSTKEYEFLLRGVVRVNNLNQTSTSKPDWITESQWDDLTLVAEMPGFRGLIGTITQMPVEWYRWYQLPDPENKFMPPWNIKCNMLQKMLILRCLRPDRLQVIMSRYVGSMLGPQFTELLALDVPSILSISSKATPLLFLPSPEYDHMVSMKRIARELNMEKELATICLGPGQTGTAEKLIENAMKTGGWVYIANCHATLSWLISYVGNIVDDLQEEIINDCHPKFRLWLSSNQLKDIPVSLLQHSIKIVTQPVRGIRANMEYVYHSMSPAVFNPSSPQYKKLFYTLSFLHSVLVERKKFGPLGWITPYYFRDVDFELSKNILTSYLNEYGQSIPWGSVQRLIGDVVYGGIVPNEWDLRVFNAHCKDYLVKECLTDGHELVPGVPQYSVPDKGSLDSHLSHIQALPDDDHPQAFGQDRNADVTAASTDTMTLLQTVLPLILEPNVNQDDDSTVVSLARSILDQLPQQRIKHPYIEHPDHPTLIENIVFRERYTYNHLLSVINNSLTELIIALQGNTCSTSQQVEMCQCLYNGRVPKAWQSAYPSMKPLRFWLIDFLERLSYFQSWAVHGPPVVFWLAAFTSPSEFFVTIKQMVSRAKRIPMDKLDLLFIPMRDTDVTTPHKEGVYLRGLYLEGAGWDRERLCLCEPNPMQMTTELPVFLCRVVCRLECTSNMYTCPVYRLPCRGQVLIEIKLKCGDKTAEHWIKRGTAVLLSTVST